ncbi:MAG: hypoxanthine phosphoribosyltransferase [Bacteroidota bacterium]
MPNTQTAPAYVTCQEERFRLYIDEARLQARVQELGAEISATYAGKRPILVGVLNGAFIFLADLMRSITVDCEVDFLKLSSYGDRKVSSGNVEELKSLDAQIQGRHVLIVEDIVDTGLSMQYMMSRLAAAKPASLASAVLLHKPDAAKVEVQLDYVAFSIPNLFVLGYGLDYGQLGRNLPAVYILDESASGLGEGDQ